MIKFLKLILAVLVVAVLMVPVLVIYNFFYMTPDTGRFVYFIHESAQKNSLDTKYRAENYFLSNPENFFQDNSIYQVRYTSLDNVYKGKARLMQALKARDFDEKAYAAIIVVIGTASIKPILPTSVRTTSSAIIS